MGLPEVMLGIVPGWGGMLRLPERIGPQAALDMMLTGKTIDGKRAKRLGLADFSPDQLDLLAFGRGLDTTAMRQVFGFEPEFTTREAFADFARSLPALLPGTEALDAAVSGAAESVGAAVGGLIDVTTRQVDQVSAWTRRDH